MNPLSTEENKQYHLGGKRAHLKSSVVFTGVVRIQWNDIASGSVGNPYDDVGRGRWQMPFPCLCGVMLALRVSFDCLRGEVSDFGAVGSSKCRLLAGIPSCSGGVVQRGWCWTLKGELFSRCETKVVDSYRCYAFIIIVSALLITSVLAQATFHYVLTGIIWMALKLVQCFLFNRSMLFRLISHPFLHNQNRWMNCAWQLESTLGKQKYGILWTQCWI